MYFSVFMSGAKRGMKKVGLLDCSEVNEFSMEKDERSKRLKNTVVKLMSKENVTRTTKRSEARGLFNFLVSLNKRAFVHHSVDYRGSNYLDLKMLSASNGSTQIFHSKSFGG